MLCPKAFYCYVKLLNSLPLIACQGCNVRIIMTRYQHFFSQKFVQFGMVAAIGITVGLGVAHAATAQTVAGKPQTVAQVDLNRYTGTWYEIARLPMFFQRQCASDVTATYRLKPSGAINVDNQCRDKNGKVIQSMGEATQHGDSTSRLKVTFLPQGLRWLPVGKADYWILALDDNYQHALVGTPNTKYLWILSRTPTMDDTVYRQYVALARQQGYDVSQLQPTPHHLGAIQTP